MTNKKNKNIMNIMHLNYEKVVWDFLRALIGWNRVSKARLAKNNVKKTFVET